MAKVRGSEPLLHMELSHMGSSSFLGGSYLMGAARDPKRGP